MKKSFWYKWYIKWVSVHPSVRMRMRRINEEEYFKVWARQGMLLVPSCIDRTFVLLYDRIVLNDWKPLFKV